MFGVLLAATTLACHAPLPHGPQVPAPVVLSTSCGRFVLSRGGEVGRLRHRAEANQTAVSLRSRGTQLFVRRNRAGRIFVLRHRRLVWRSHDLYPNDGGDIAFRPHALAFASYRRGIFLTDLQGPERLVVRGRGLFPYDFDRESRLIVGAHRTIDVIAPSGATLRRYRYRQRNGFVFDERTDRLFFITPRGVLASARGTKIRLVRPLPNVEGTISADQSGLLIFGGMHDIAVIRPDGALVARTNWARSPRVASDSGVSVSPDGKSFAFRLTDAHPGSRSSTATVYVLRAGTESPQRIFRHRLGPSGCAVGANLNWHGRFLLYSSTDGREVVLDTTNDGAIDLTQLARLLPHRNRGEIVGVSWQSDFESEY